MLEINKDLLEINKVYTLKTGEKILINEIRITIGQPILYRNTDYSRMYKKEDFVLPKKKEDPIKKAIKEVKLK